VSATDRLPKDAPERGEVVLDAAVRAAELLGLSQAQLARVLGIDPSTLSRRLSSRRGLDDRSREYEAALLWIRLFRGLQAVVGGQDSTARAWLASPNLAFAGQRPRDLINGMEGLVRVVQYLDAHRAQL
jgi:transcriptional regulator with XRE-family HTH domain